MGATSLWNVTDCGAFAAKAAATDKPNKSLVWFMFLLAFSSSLALGGRIYFRVHHYVEPANHHFFPSLVSPLDYLRGIGIRGIVRRIVKMRRTFKTGSLRQQQGVTQN